MRPFVLAVSTDDQEHPQHVVTEPAVGFTKAAPAEWMTLLLHADAEAFSDGLGVSFRAASEHDHAHTVIKAGGGRAACDAEGACWVNIVKSTIRPAPDDAYHVFRFFKYAQRYLAKKS